MKYWPIVVIPPALIALAFFGAYVLSGLTHGGL